jgi:hypothetical protein
LADVSTNPFTQFCGAKNLSEEFAPLFFRSDNGVDQRLRVGTVRCGRKVRSVASRVCNKIGREFAGM